MEIYVPLSVAMFLEYAIWGAWAPVLAVRLLGPLKMNGKQTGWIYATLPLACIVAPFISGQLADQWLNAEWILAAAHLIGAVLLLIAARTTSFGKLFGVMLAYSMCYAATLPLVNSLLFAHVQDGPTQSAVFIWAPVSWALIGYLLSGWRNLRGVGQGSDCLILAALLSLVMGVACCFMPATPPAGTAGFPIRQTLAMLGEFNFLVFVVVSVVVGGLMQFYFLGTGQFMKDSGIAEKNVPASMGIAQAVQAIATWFLLGYFITHQQFQLGLVVGTASWLVMYVIYIVGKPRGLIVVSQGFHGLAYVLFIIVGQVFVNTVAPEAIRSSMQALIFAATVGVGLFLGTKAAGFFMDLFSAEGKFQWRKIWFVPAVVTAIGVVVLLTVFHNPPA